MAMNRNWVVDSLTAYELIEESESIEEMNDNVRYWIELLHNASYDLCLDNGWNDDEIDID